MSRLGVWFTSGLANSIVQHHDVRVAERKAKQIVLDAAPDYMPAKLRAVVRAGLGEHLRADERAQFGRCYAYVYSGTDITKLEADRKVQRAVARLMPAGRAADRYALRRPILEKLRSFNTVKQLLKAHPELAELVAYRRDGGPEPDPVKLRRALLRAGWPLRKGGAA